MIKMVIFDLDGTLVNSLKDLAVSVNYALKSVGLNVHPVDNYKKFVGNGRDKLIKRALGSYADDEELFKTVKTVYDKHYTEHCNDNTSSYNGCEKLLNDLSDEGILTAVLSNKPDEFVEPILSKLFPKHTFTEAWGKKPEYKTKPEPDALYAMMSEHKLNPDECIYVGDSDVDVYTANNAGIKMVGVSWGFRGRKELIDAGAPFVADTAEELFKYICDFNE